MCIRDSPWGGGVSNVDEAAFETFICDWLVGPGGYDAVKIGNPKDPQPDFDADRALDTAEPVSYTHLTLPTSDLV